MVDTVTPTSSAAFVTDSVISPIFNNTTQVTLGGYAHNVVKCLETGQIWESVTKAAEDVGVTVSTMSKVLNGHSDGVQGLHYAIIALGSGV